MFSMVTNTSDLVTVYLDQIGQIPRIDAEREVVLGRIIQQGQQAQKALATAAPDEVPTLQRQIEAGKKARTEFINANLRLVIGVARRYQWSGMALGDLIQHGNIGLMRAVDKFNPDLGFKFSTYATNWIVQAVGRGIEIEIQTIRLPGQVRHARNVVNQAMLALEQAGIPQPTEQQILNATNMTAEQYRVVATAPGPTASIHAPVSSEYEDVELTDYLADLDVIDPEQAAIDNDLYSYLHDLVAELAPRDQLLIRMRFGFGDNKPLAIGVIAKELGVTHRTVNVRLAQLMRLLAVRLDPSPQPEAV